MAELQNQFTWSAKRGNVFAECRRRYWFEYYGYWGGWSPQADDRTRSIYVLKQLKGRQAWAGEHVHAAAHAALQLIHARLEPKPDEIVEEVRRRMQAEFRESKAREYWRRPKKACGLLEHEFELPVTDAEWRATSDHVEKCIRNFFRSEHVERLRALDRSRWLEIEELQQFAVEGVPVWAKLDLAYRPDHIVIVDWKTGKLDPHPDPMQLTCYAIYASAKWGVPPEEIETVQVNLGANESVSRRVDRALVDSVRARIVESMRTMAQYVDGPVDENLPVPESAFPVTDGTAACRRCPFRGVCPDSPLHRL